MIAEGMSYGKPIVATRVGGIPELVTDCESGYLVERGDTAQMAERILALAADCHLRRKMGQAGRLTAETHFDLRKNVARLIDLYGLAEI